MILIIGGAYQGKQDYAKEHYPTMLPVYNLHEIILEQIKEGIDPLEDYKKKRQHYENAVITCDDISSGIVPIDPTLRQWRESVGQVLALVARESDEVIRLFCGIGTKLK